MPMLPQKDMPGKDRVMASALLRILPGVFLCMLFFAGEAAAQTGRTGPVVKIGGLGYVDYFYRFGDDDETFLWQKPKDTLWDSDRDATINDAFHGFTYRRLYLTTDAAISERFKARFRLEASDSKVGSGGPVPFVKDMWIDWKYAGDHSARMGVMPPPAFQLSESVWGFRSLEKTILDVQGINSSRDFGIRFDGPVPVRGDLVRYAAMLANGEGNRADSDKYKKGYARISIHPAGKLVFSAGVDYGKHQLAPQEDIFISRREARMSVFGGYEGDRLRFGLEAFRYELTWLDETYATTVRSNENEAGYVEIRQKHEPTMRIIGLSAFGSAKVHPRAEFVGRLDLTRNDDDFAATYSDDPLLNETLALAGIAFSPHENVRVIPNLWWFGSEIKSDDYPGDELVGKRKNRMLRVTIEASF